MPACVLGPALVRAALAWYLGASSQELGELCHKLYPDVR